MRICLLCSRRSLDWNTRQRCGPCRLAGSHRTTPRLAGTVLQHGRWGRHIGWGFARPTNADLRGVDTAGLLRRPLTHGAVSCEPIAEAGAPAVVPTPSVARAVVWARRGDQPGEKQQGACLQHPRRNACAQEEPQGTGRLGSARGMGRQPGGCSLASFESHEVDERVAASFRATAGCCSPRPTARPAEPRAGSPWPASIAIATCKDLPAAMAAASTACELPSRRDLAMCAPGGRAFDQRGSSRPAWGLLMRFW